MAVTGEQDRAGSEHRVAGRGQTGSVSWAWLSDGRLFQI